MMNIYEKIQVFCQKCRENGLKVTPQRIEIFKALAISDDHPSADTVHKRVKETMPSISLDTVNRTLNTLSQIGAAFVVEGSGDVKRFDGNLDSHQHFKCIKCKKIFDFHHIPFDNMQLPEGVRNKFKIMRTVVYAEGLCENCSKEQNNKKEKD